MKKLNNKQDTLSTTYLSQVIALRDKMHFFTFENEKLYSFDYTYKKEFELFVKNIDKLSVSVKNIIPIFLPKSTARIAFFSYASKSVRAVNIENLESMLKRQAEKKYKNGEIRKEEANTFVKEDIEIFNSFQKQHNFTKYRQDIKTKTVQFNAYSEDDTVLIEKSYIRGGLIFDMREDEFDKKIIVTYPRHRKRRSDKKDDYLPLKLIEIRGLE